MTGIVVVAMPLLTVLMMAVVSVQGWTITSTGSRMTATTTKTATRPFWQSRHATKTATAPMPSSSSATTLFHDIMDDYRDDHDYIDDDYLDDNTDGFDCSGISGSNSNNSDDQDESTASTMGYDDDEGDSTTRAESTPQQHQQVRAQISGVSVSVESGFWVMLQFNNPNNANRKNIKDNNGIIWPCHVTNQPMMDRTAATSGQALTLVQLLSRVDMAGVILPPTVLAQLIAVALEDLMYDSCNDDDDTTTRDTASLDAPWQCQLLENMQSQMKALYGTSSSQDDEDNDDDYFYADASVWIRSRVRLPTCTLDQVHFDLSSSSSTTTPHIELDVAVRGVENDNNNNHYRCTLPNVLSESTVSSVLLEEYTPHVSRNFLALALALRYKAPILVTLPMTTTTPETTSTDTVTNENTPTTTTPQPMAFYRSEDDLKAAFPLYTTVQNLQKSSNRVEQNIERSFEIHQLQAAFKIARQKQDFKAMAKIQEKLDDLDQAAIKELPVQPESDMDCMQ